MNMWKDERKVKLDPTKITYDGRGFSAVISDPIAFNKRLESLRREVIEDLEGHNMKNSVEIVIGIKGRIRALENCIKNIRSLEDQMGGVEEIIEFYETRIDELNMVLGFIERE
jgi:hypothetical protein